MTILIISIVILLLIVISLTIALIDAKKYSTKVGEELTGMCNTTFERSEKRQGNLDKIISLFETDKELTNTEIRQALQVSSRTAVRYMDELERENKVIQTGKTGYLTTYKIKK
jgi:predicted HTH transcriptional regulator